MSLFVKRYANPDRAQAAHENYMWLRSLGSGVLFPELVASHQSRLIFDGITGDQASPSHVQGLAIAIGKIHRAAEPFLAPERGGSPQHSFATGIKDFASSRRYALRRAFRRHSRLLSAIDSAMELADGLPHNLYKDSNLRNFILHSEGVVVVDFDDLTRAPYGYDLGKLIVSTAMTHGPLTALEIAEALAAYNAAVGWEACSMRNLALWIELNWLLTAKYMGRNGYHHPWPSARPWHDPLSKGGREWQSPPS